MKDFEKEIVNNDEILNFVNEIKMSIREDMYKNDAIKDLKLDFPEKIMKLEETLLNYIAENDLKIFKTEFIDNKWKYLTEKLAYPYEYFNSIDVYQKPVDNLKREDFFSKWKNNCPDDEEIE